MMKTGILAIASLLLLVPVWGWGDHSFQPIRTPIRRFRPLQQGQLRPNPISVEQRKSVNSDQVRANSGRLKKEFVTRQKEVIRQLEGADAMKMLGDGDVSKLMKDAKLSKDERLRIENAYREMADTMKRRGREMRIELKKSGLQ